jgi:hypothetical protein
VRRALDDELRWELIESSLDRAEGRVDAWDGDAARWKNSP